MKPRCFHPDAFTCAAPPRAAAEAAWCGGGGFLTAEEGFVCIQTGSLSALPRGPPLDAADLDGALLLAAAAAAAAALALASSAAFDVFCRASLL